MGWRMIDDRNPPIEPAEDPALDALLASTGEFPTPPDFEHRVMRTVRLPLPDWALRVRSFKTALFHTRGGRAVVAVVSLGCVASVAATINFFRVNGQPVRESLGWLGRQVGIPTWRLSLRTLTSSFIDFMTSLLPAGMTTRSFALLAGAVVTVSAVGLYITAGPPALRSRHAR